ncbi:MAG: hypothetical protein IJM04_14280, partial [Prevotella sp.]|nr:hypothetical protein [Prevotella sp.]
MAEKNNPKTTANEKVVKTRTTRKRAPKHIGLVAHDGYLEPYEGAITGRHDHALWKLNQLTRNGKITLKDFASGYDYYGLHRTARGWVFREWAPTATDIYLVGDFNDWQETEKYRAKRVAGTGNWELKLPSKAMKHGDLYKMHVHWNGGEGERIPAWAQRVVQDDNTKIFSAQVWAPAEPYVWKKKSFKPNVNPLLIYECHIGMSQDAEKVGSYTEFKENVLPRVIADGYNCIQIMAIQEHPYYGSFGYHVSSFFAASSRFGTPEELKSLIDTAHQNGTIATTTFGLEAVLNRELEALGVKEYRTMNGRTRFKGDVRMLAKANLWLRTADRILLNMGEFKALTFEELFQGVKKIPWENLLGKDAAFIVNARSVKSKIYSLRDIQAISKKAIAERLKKVYSCDWLNETGARYMIEVAFLEDNVTVTVDTSGHGLNKRG